MKCLKGNYNLAAIVYCTFNITLKLRSLLNYNFDLIKFVCVSIILSITVYTIIKILYDILQIQNLLVRANPVIIY